MVVLGAIVGMACGASMDVIGPCVASLRATTFSGDIHLGMRPSVRMKKYLRRRARVRIHPEPCSDASSKEEAIQDLGTRMVGSTGMSTSRWSFFKQWLAEGEYAAIWLLDPIESVFQTLPFPMAVPVIGFFSDGQDASMSKPLKTQLDFCVGTDAWPSVRAGSMPMVSNGVILGNSLGIKILIEGMAKLAESANTDVDGCWVDDTYLLNLWASQHNIVKFGINVPSLFPKPIVPLGVHPVPHKVVIYPPWRGGAIVVTAPCTIKAHFKKAGLKLKKLFNMGERPISVIYRGNLCPLTRRYTADPSYYQNVAPSGAVQGAANSKPSALEPLYDDLSFDPKLAAEETLDDPEEQPASTPEPTLDLTGASPPSKPKPKPRPQGTTSAPPVAPSLPSAAPASAKAPTAPAEDDDPDEEGGADDEGDGPDEEPARSVPVMAGVKPKAQRTRPSRQEDAEEAGSTGGKAPKGKALAPTSSMPQRAGKVLAVFFSIFAAASAKRAYEAPESVLAQEDGGAEKTLPDRLLDAGARAFLRQMAAIGAKVGAAPGSGGPNGADDSASDEERVALTKDSKAERPAKACYSIKGRAVAPSSGAPSPTQLGADSDDNASSNDELRSAKFNVKRNVRL